MKLPALKGGASREGISSYTVPLGPALKGGACGALAGQNPNKNKSRPARMVPEREPS